MSIRAGGMQFSRWRARIGSYMLPALPEMVVALHWAGKPTLGVWADGAWSTPLIKAGCISIIPPGHATGWRIDGELDAVTIAFAATDVGSREPSLRIAEPDALAIELGRQILAETQAPLNQSAQDHVALLITTLGAHLRRPRPLVHCAEMDGSPSHWRIGRVQQYIRDHPGHAHAIETLAERAGLNPFHFSRLFKKIVGTTPRQYVIESRMAKAKAMLSQTSVPIGQIADLLGFTSQSHFTRQFSGVHGEAPGTFRRRLAAQSIKI